MDQMIRRYRTARERGNEGEGRRREARYYARNVQAEASRERIRFTWHCRMRSIARRGSSCSLMNFHTVPRPRRRNFRLLSRDRSLIRPLLGKHRAGGTTPREIALLSSYGSSRGYVITKITSIPTTRSQIARRGDRVAGSTGEGTTDALSLRSTRYQLLKPSTCL